MTERPVLTNVRAEKVRMLKSLAGRSARRRRGLFLAEGPQAAREAVSYANVLEVLIDEAAARRYPEIVATSHSRRIVVRDATEQVMAAISDAAQGVVAVVVTDDEEGNDCCETGLSGVVYPGQGLEALLVGAQLVVVLVDARDPGNLGTIIRTADAAGADVVVLAGDCVDVTNPKVVRATAGSLFHLPVVHVACPQDAIAALRTEGLRVRAATGAGEVALGDLGKSRCAWVFGNEAHGLDEQVLALADERVRIPMPGRAESLNLAAAVAVCIYSEVLAR